MAIRDPTSSESAAPLVLWALFQRNSLMLQCMLVAPPLFLDGCAGVRPAYPPVAALPSTSAVD